MKIKLLTILITIVFYTISPSFSGENNTDLSIYTGTFDVIDKQNDHQTSLIGIEHRDNDLFRNTFLGKLSPITGAFITGDSALYFYTGVEASYSLGPIDIKPSFSPGYYEAGDGKDLGMALEFKSEIKLDINIFENSKLGYSYSHMSNNDWGETNPGSNNQSISFSQKF
jgi:lipid A 3-O-deacylase